MCWMGWYRQQLVNYTAEAGLDWRGQSESTTKEVAVLQGSRWAWRARHRVRARLPVLSSPSA